MSTIQQHCTAPIIESNIAITVLEKSLTMKNTSQCQSTQLLRKVAIITGHSAAVCYRKNSTEPVDQIGDENSTRRELQAF